MLDYIISLKTVLFAGVIGGVSGYLVSYLIDNYFLEAQTETDTEVQTTDDNYQRVIKRIGWGLLLIGIWSAIFISAATLDYLLSFAPSRHGMKFLENETVATLFSLSFFAGMANTLLRIGELAFAAIKKD